MEASHLARLGSPISKPPGPAPHLGGMPGHGEGSLTSTRRATHDGHAIVITTTYSITVDGEPLHAHVEVDDLGRVHCHGLPNYNFGSALDMVKALIDSEPPPPPGHHGDGDGDGDTQDHDDHDHGGGRDRGRHDQGGGR